METPAEGDVAGVEDSILPMSLVQNELTDRESMALQQLYQDAAHAYWVERIGQSDAVPQATDLETATQLGVQGCWTRGLLVQAAVMEALGITRISSFHNVPHLCQCLIVAFSDFVRRGEEALTPLGDDPHLPTQTYLAVWQGLHDAPPESHDTDEDTTEELPPGAMIAAAGHPGLLSDVPRKRRSGAPGANGEHSSTRKAHRSLPASMHAHGADMPAMHPNDLARHAQADAAAPDFLAGMPGLQGMHFKTENLAGLGPLNGGHGHFGLGIDAMVDVAPAADMYKHAVGLEMLADASAQEAAYYGAHGHHADDRPGGPNGGHDGTPNLDMAFAMHPPHARPGHHHTPRPSTASKLVPSVSELQQCDTLEKLQSVFHLPINDAAASLGMGVTVLKKLCRDREIKRWPFRKLSSVDKLIESVKKVLQTDDQDESAIQAYQALIDLRNHIFDDPTQDLDDWAKKLRQANFKQQYKMRQHPTKGEDEDDLYDYH